MKYEFKKIQVLGITKDFNICDCCGKENLKETVAILDLESNVIVHFGTTCAFKSDKFDSMSAYKEAERELKKTLNKLKQIKKDAISFNWRYLKSIYGCTSINNTMTVNCDLDTVNKCYDQVVSWMMKPWNERGIFEFKTN